MTPETRLHLLDDVPACGAVFELGVARGAFSWLMLNYRHDITVYSVDRWTDHHDEKEYLAAVELLAPYGDRSEIWRMTFAEAANLVEDGVVDLVYVDGYAFTGQDNGQTLRDWWPKVQPGGIFAGHDYCDEFRPTVDAVNEFAREHNLTVEIIPGDNHPSWRKYPSWRIQKPDHRLGRISPIVLCLLSDY